MRDEIMEQEIYWDLFCGGERPTILNPDDFKLPKATARVVSPDEWNLIQQTMTDEEKAIIAYEL